MSSNSTDAFIKKGVVIPAPNLVYIGPEVKVDRIAAGVTLHAGTRIEGASTSIGPKSIVSAEGSMVVRDCQLGSNVILGSGYAEGSVFLDGASVGGGAHVRPGCLLEEQSSVAHTVGLKQTVLMPFVTLGSLINFCDIFMSGGTSRKNHSEVGSSFIHFNYTPHQDKATPSLVGDVVHGILLDQAPIFLGGQGGLVGPARITFGTVVPAGQIIRRDILDANQLHVAAAPMAGNRLYDASVYGPITRLVLNNLLYIGNINALLAWYQAVREPLMANDTFAQACCAGAQDVLKNILKERIKRLAELTDKLSVSITSLEHRDDERSLALKADQEQWVALWPRLSEHLKTYSPLTQPAPEALVLAVKNRNPSGSYIETVASFDATTKKSVTSWLSDIVARTATVAS